MECEQKAIRVTEPEHAELVTVAGDASPLGPTEVVGRTLFSLVSAGTELAVYRGLTGNLPRGLGYASVFEVEDTGEDVEAVLAGDVVFSMGGHQSRQRHDASEVVPVPEGLAPERAVFARLMAVSQTTLVTTEARPPGRVVVTGLGLVGNLAAQVFASCGYTVSAVEPREDRRELARRSGVEPVFAAAPLEDQNWAGTVDLVVECSGHEAAALDGCRLVRKGGEVVLVGVPWEKRAGLDAFDILDEVFHRYVTLRSGWEWELPRHDRDFARGSIYRNLAGGLGWLVEGRVRTDGLAEAIPPEQAGEAYRALSQSQCPTLTYLFDWQVV
jgi:threonine dehydrogenase-like Zn-dependent dehydrogenase